ncbi:MAG TPA: NHLP leader peptide family RiPP precursor [Elusimicrobiota bacterium]|jgi:putative modified peptide|nr:NHLP leader peptide family RiPP precursor [Elusimicrobiota bacterium]
MSNANQLQELAQKAVTDDAFRARAKKDPNGALAGVGVQIPAGTAVKVYENTANEIHAVLPEKADASALKAVDPNVAKVFEKAWSDAAFKAELLKNPAAAIKAATNAKLPNNLKIVVHENTAKELNFVLPYVPPKSAELSDADLEMVAGGKGNVNAGGCGQSLQTQGAVVAAGAAFGAATAPSVILGGIGGAVAIGGIFSSFITMAVSASK